MRNFVNDLFGINSPSLKEMSIELEKAKKNTNAKAEEWIWVKGYKGTDKNMMCRDYQYEMDKTFYMPEKMEIKLCENGFHFCTKLRDVYQYYAVGDGDRFFEVEAMVRKSEYDKIINKYNEPTMLTFSFGLSDSKLTAKSIRFVRELGRDEILDGMGLDVSDWTEDQKDRALLENVFDIINEVDKIRQEKERAEQTEKLLACGYNEWLAKYIVSHDMFEKAYAVGCQEGLSIDMKVFAIFNNNDEDDD